MKLQEAIQAVRTETASAFATLELAITELVTAARYNDLTGLRNAVALEEDFGQVQRNAVAHHICFGDLNGFKNINDEHSHAAGDAALARTGDILRVLVDPWKATAYHQSGDEFVILVPSVHMKGLLVDLERHCQQISLAFEDRGGEKTLQLSGSFGCAEIGDLDLASALRRAESACQVAKRRGREHVVHEWSPDDEVEEVTRRFRCVCGTAVRCTVASEAARLVALKCPVCGEEAAAGDTAQDSH